MKIIDVKTITISCPLKKHVEMSFGKMTMRTNVLIQIDTDEGISGIGESWTNYPHWAPDERKITVEKALKPLLIGEDPTNISYLWNKMYISLLKSGAGYQYESKGPLYQSMSGVDVALWDILGKKMNVPVYQLLGGKVCSKVKAYASGLAPQNYEECIEKGKREGYSAFKLRVGFDKNTDLQTLKAIRDLIGYEDLLFTDANQGWNNAQEALCNIKHYEDYHVAFIEEPVSAGQIAELKKIKDSGILPVAGGENLYARFGFKDTLTNEALSIVQPDITKTGGLSEARIICQMASAWGLPYAPHMFGTAVGLAASLHLMASVPGGLYMEVDASPNLALTDLLADTFYKFENGCFIIGDDKPGLGIKLNMDMVEQYSIK